MYFKVLELYMKKNSLRFYDSFLQSEFILYFSCRVKNTFLTILTVTLHTALVSCCYLDPYEQTSHAQYVLASL